MPGAIATPLALATASVSSTTSRISSRTPAPAIILP